jgi:hypothetical protein
LKTTSQERRSIEPKLQEVRAANAALYGLRRDRRSECIRRTDEHDV